MSVLLQQEGQGQPRENRSGYISESFSLSKPAQGEEPPCGQTGGSSSYCTGEVYTSPWCPGRDLPTSQPRDMWGTGVTLWNEADPQAWPLP